MKCAEVMEWMHRYLDHDLSQDEIIEMFRHIDDCPSCADVFDRLTLLSQQLEQLPDVKPPFSLVDSIMPQLDKLDQGVQEHGATSIEDSKVVPFTRKSTHGKKFKGNSIAARTGIGAVAAAVILLIAIFNMPGSMPAADVDQALNKAADVSSSNQSMEKSAESTGSAMDAGQGSSADKANADSTAANLPEPSSGPTDGNNNTSPVAPTIAPTQNSSVTAPAKSKEPVMGKGRSIAKPESTAATPAARNKSAVSSQAPSEDSSSQGVAANMPNDAAADHSDRAKEPLGAHDETSAGAKGILPSLMMTQPTWTSPDGRLDAELAGQQLVIYTNQGGASNNGRTALTSLSLEGTWVSGSWSADSREFTYVTEQEGNEVTKVYTVPDSAASALPSASPAASSAATPAVTPDAATSAK
ncbi:anti-sigma factor family protein [Paenibacillus sp. HW567]|uniref:anti-sigma factor family protein n=1 Tax=Paenibacillus sp. HW567 TaxID=1034769 RepID=UPI000369BAC4|nr:anti-sigma factor [Paenibacillus sp. HW567]